MELDSLDSSYQVYTEEFRGPLDQLLSAARGKDLPLTSINIAELIDDFLNHLKQQLSLRVNSISIYLLLFSELVRIKSRSLLPGRERKEESEPEPNDSPPDEFFNRAKDYLWNRAELRSPLHETQPDLPETITSGKTHHREVTLFELIKAFKDLRDTHRESNYEPSLTITNDYNTVDQMDYILSLLDDRNPIPFHDLLGNSPTKEEIIVSFLAILQLVKQKDIRIVKEVEKEGIYVVGSDFKTNE